MHPNFANLVDPIDWFDPEDPYHLRWFYTRFVQPRSRGSSIAFTDGFPEAVSMEVRSVFQSDVAGNVIKLLWVIAESNTKF